MGPRRWRAIVLTAATAFTLAAAACSSDDAASRPAPAVTDPDVAADLRALGVTDAERRSLTAEDVAAGAADPATRVRRLGRATGHREEADDLIADFDFEVEQARNDVPDDCRISMATVAADGSVRVWVRGPAPAPTLAAGIGCTLVPAATEVTVGEDGSAPVPADRLALLAAPQLVLVQGSADGEDRALEGIAGDPAWAALPAVTAGRVLTLERDSYRGIEGWTDLVADLASGITG